jgi:uncharacterized delta-60 repeat protein
MRVQYVCMLAGLLTLHACSDKSPAEPSKTYTIGGTVSGLEGSGLVLTNDFTDDVSPGNGPFAFDRRYEDATFYSVRVSTQPASPVQVCTVGNGTGVIAAADVTDVAVTCTTAADNDNLDPTFDLDGRATADLVDGAHDMALQADGRIVIINEFDVTRFSADGSPDASFGSGGRVHIDFPGTLDRLRALAIQDDGRIIIAGLTWFGNNADVAVARLNSNGSPDATFGTNGMITTDSHGFGDDAADVLVQPDGYIVVGGISVQPGGDSDFALFRYTPDGDLDAGFGTGGIATINVGGRADIAHAIALQQDGRLLITGRVADSGGADPDIGVARFNPDGTLDTTFGVNGTASTVTPDTWEQANDIAVQPDGRIVLVGHIRPPGMVPTRFLMMRLEAAGTLDMGFGTDGVAETAIFSDENDHATAVVLQPDGRIVVVGQNANLGQPDFAIARYNVDGSLDADFAEGGMTTVDFFGSVDAARAVAITKDGGILVAGMAREGNKTGVGLAKLKP